MTELERIRCTAIEAATKYRDLLGVTHLAHLVGKRRDGWAYYDKIKIPELGHDVRVQREWLGDYTTNRWPAQREVELVPIDEIPVDQLPDNIRKDRE